jgi:hypothetical protein
MKVDEALRLLREADPAGIEPADGPDTADVPGRRPGRPRRQIALAAGAVIAVIGLVAVMAALSGVGGSRPVLNTRSSPSPQVSSKTYALPPEKPSFGPTGTLGTWDDPNFAPTLERVLEALASVPTLPQAVLVDRAPSAELELPWSYPSNGALVDRAGFWTAPGTGTEAVAYYRAHPPTGMSLTGEGKTGSPGQERFEVIFGNPDVSRDTPWIQISVVAYRDGVAVRVDAMAVWIPTKLARAYIGVVDSVDITVDRRSTAPTIHRTLTGAAAQRLADAVDALQPATPGTYSCANDHGIDVLLFHSASAAAIRVETEAGGCGFVTVTANGVVQLGLVGGLDTQVLAELGLPWNYGR